MSVCVFLDLPQGLTKEVIRSNRGEFSQDNVAENLLDVFIKVRPQSAAQDTRPLGVGRMIATILTFLAVVHLSLL